MHRIQYLQPAFFLQKRLNKPDHHTELRRTRHTILHSHSFLIALTASSESERAFSSRIQQAARIGNSTDVFRTEERRRNGRKACDIDGETHERQKFLVGLVGEKGFDLGIEDFLNVCRYS